MKQYKDIRGSYYEDLHATGHKSQSWFYKTREEYLLEFAGLKKTDRVLDIGCGSGMVTRQIGKEVGCNIVGLDVSEDCVSYGTKKAKEEKLSNVSFRFGSMEEIPFKDNTFDVIIVSHVIEHVATPDKSVENIRKKLKPNGTLIITTPNYRSLWPIAEFVFDKTVAEKGYSLHDQHIAKFYPSKIHSLLKATGFHDIIVETHYIISLAVSLLSKRLAQKVFTWEKARASLPFGTILYVKAKKTK